MVGPDKQDVDLPNRAVGQLGPVIEGLQVFNAGGSELVRLG